MIRRCLLLLNLLWLPATGLGAETATPATVLYFTEREPGVDAYRTRMIVTPKYLRMDGNVDGEDFVLFDRRTRMLYSVSAIDRLVLVIAPQPVTVEAPKELNHKVIRDDTEFPTVSGHRVIHYELMTNDKRCYDLYAAAGLLPDVVTALRQYRQALAGQHALTMPYIPPELQTACDMANHIFAPARHLEYGLPVRLVDMTGKISELVDYDTKFRAPTKLLRLPQDYRRQSIEELRGGP